MRKTKGAYCLPEGGGLDGYSIAYINALTAHKGFEEFKRKKPPIQPADVARALRARPRDMTVLGWIEPFSGRAAHLGEEATGAV